MCLNEEMSRLTFQTKRETKRVTEGKKGGMGGGMVEEEGGKGRMVGSHLGKSPG